MKRWSVEEKRRARKSTVRGASVSGGASDEVGNFEEVEIANYTHGKVETARCPWAKAIELHKLERRLNGQLKLCKRMQREKIKTLVQMAQDRTARRVHEFNSRCPC